MAYFAAPSLLKFLFSNNISKILPVILLLFCHNMAWASPIELSKSPFAYVIKADGSLASINENSRWKDSIEVSGDSMGMMFTNIMAGHIKRPILKIGIRVKGPLVFMNVWYGLGDSNKYYLGELIYLYGDGKYHQYNIDFKAYNVQGNRIKTLYIYFGNSINDISIRGISLYSHSGNFSDTLSITLENFLRPKIVERDAINFIVSPKIFSMSLIAFLNILSAILLMLVAGYYLWQWGKYKKTGIIRKSIISLLTILMLLWVLADVRIIYDELYHIKLMREGYLKPQNNNDNFFFCFKAYYEFIKYIKNNIPEKVKNVTFYTPPDDMYIAIAKYYLYPIIAASQKEEELFKVFYRYPFAEIREDKLYYMNMDGRLVAEEKGRIIKRYRKDTFVFFKSQNE